MLTRRTIVLPEAMLVGEQVTLLPEALKAWRRERKLSQRALALAAGCSEGLVSTIESGHRQASIGVAIKIAKALNVTVPAIGLVHIDLDELYPAEELPEAS